MDSIQEDQVQSEHITPSQSNTYQTKQFVVSKPIFLGIIILLIFIPVVCFFIATSNSGIIKKNVNTESQYLEANPTIVEAQHREITVKTEINVDGINEVTLMSSPTLIPTNTPSISQAKSATSSGVTPSPTIALKEGQGAVINGFNVAQDFKQITFTVIYNEKDAHVEFEVYDPDGIRYTKETEGVYETRGDDIYMAWGETYRIIRISSSLIKKGVWKTLTKAPPIEVSIQLTGLPTNQ